MKLRVLVFKVVASGPYLTFYERNAIARAGFTIWHNAEGVEMGISEYRIHDPNPKLSGIQIELQTG